MKLVNAKEKLSDLKVLVDEIWKALKEAELVNGKDEVAKHDLKAYLEQEHTREEIASNSTTHNTLLKLFKESCGKKADDKVEVCHVLDHLDTDGDGTITRAEFYSELYLEASLKSVTRRCCTLTPHLSIAGFCRRSKLLIVTATARYHRPVITPRNIVSLTW